MNRARPFIFTTALAPAAAAVALSAIGVFRVGRGATRRAALRRHVDAVRPGHPSPIIPVVLGSEAAAVDAAACLLEAGLLVPAIRPPTVPPGTCRLRVSLSASHHERDVARLVAALGRDGETPSAGDGHRDRHECREDLGGRGRPARPHRTRTAGVGPETGPVLCPGGDHDRRRSAGGRECEDPPRGVPTRPAGIRFRWRRRWRRPPSVCRCPRWRSWNGK